MKTIKEIACQLLQFMQRRVRMLKENCQGVDYAAGMNFYDIAHGGGRLTDGFETSHRLYRYLQAKYPIPFAYTIDPICLFEMESLERVRHSDLVIGRQDNQSQGSQDHKKHTIAGCMLYREKKFICGGKPINGRQYLNGRQYPHWDIIPCRIVRAWVMSYVFYKENETLCAIISFWIAIVSLLITIITVFLV